MLKTLWGIEDISLGPVARLCLGEALKDAVTLATDGRALRRMLKLFAFWNQIGLPKTPNGSQPDLTSPGGPPG